jgi:hypothetical protein
MILNATIRYIYPEKQRQLKANTIVITQYKEMKLSVGFSLLLIQIALINVNIPINLKLAVQLKKENKNPGYSLVY